MCWTCSQQRHRVPGTHGLRAQSGIFRTRTHPDVPMMAGSPRCNMHAECRCVGQCEPLISGLLGFERGDLSTLPLLAGFFGDRIVLRSDNSGMDCATGNFSPPPSFCRQYFVVRNTAATSRRTGNSRPKASCLSSNVWWCVRARGANKPLVHDPYRAQ